MTQTVARLLAESSAKEKRAILVSLRAALDEETAAMSDPAALTKAEGHFHFYGSFPRPCSQTPACLFSGPGPLRLLGIRNAGGWATAKRPVGRSGFVRDPGVSEGAIAIEEISGLYSRFPSSAGRA